MMYTLSLGTVLLTHSSPLCRQCGRGLGANVAGMRSTREPRPNHDAHAVPRPGAVDQLAAAVYTVRERLQREPGQKEVHE